MKSRRKFTASFKAEVALEAIKEIHTVAELCQKYELSAQQIHLWKKEFLSNASSIFEKENRDSSQAEIQEKELEKLYSKIGQLQVENDFLKQASLKLTTRFNGKR